MPLSDSVTNSRAEPFVRSFCARRGGLSVAAVMIVVGALFAWQASLLPLGTLGLPGAGLFPLVLALLLVAFSITIAGRIVLEKSVDDEPVELGHSDVLIAIVAMLVIPALFESLGSYVTLGLFAAALLFFIGRVPLIRAVPAAAIGMVGVWYFFKVLLGLQLPNGILW
jgi:putative tricarboxylic transport membrane protein